jgi:hypothetical protein
VRQTIASALPGVLQSDIIVTLTPVCIGRNPTGGGSACKCKATLPSDWVGVSMNHGHAKVTGNKVGCLECLLLMLC